MRVSPSRSQRQLDLSGVVKMMTLRGLCSTALALLLVGPVACSQTLRSQFDQWMATHQKTYESDTDTSEIDYRLSVFPANAATVMNHNDAHQRGLTTYTMSLDGPFADLTDQEFESLYLMAPQNCSATHVSSGPLPYTSDSLSKSVDWRTKSVVTPIKSQGDCGSCWTFSTTETLEAHHCIAMKKDCTHWTGLAEQQLVDCAGAFNNHGCEGGLPSQAFEYIHYSGGIMTEESYNYTAKDDGYCKKVKPESVGATVSGVFNISSLDEDEIIKAVAHKGPVSVAFEVTADFRFYRHGVYDSFNATTNQTVCNKDAQHVNHAVVAVGYGETMDGDSPVPFHIIRNSWGNTWGMEGYFWMLRGQNMCGISDCASSPLVPSTTNAPQKKYLRTDPDWKEIS
jgi:cathepsin H